MTTTKKDPEVVTTKKEPEVVNTKKEPEVVNTKIEPEVVTTKKKPEMTHDLWLLTLTRKRPSLTTTYHEKVLIRSVAVQICELKNELFSNEFSNFELLKYIAIYIF